MRVCECGRRASGERRQAVCARLSLALPGVALRCFACGVYLQELIKVDGAAAVLINVGDHLLNLLLLRLEAERAHRDLQLLGIDRAWEEREAEREAE